MNYSHRECHTTYKLPSQAALQNQELNPIMEIRTTNYVFKIRVCLFLKSKGDTWLLKTCFMYTHRTRYVHWRMQVQNTPLNFCRDLYDHQRDERSELRFQERQKEVP